MLSDRVHFGSHHAQLNVWVDIGVLDSVVGNPRQLGGTGDGDEVIGDEVLTAGNSRQLGGTGDEVLTAELQTTGRDWG